MPVRKRFPGQKNETKKYRKHLKNAFNNMNSSMMLVGCIGMSLVCIVLYLSYYSTLSEGTPEFLSSPLPVEKKQEIYKEDLKTLRESHQPKILVEESIRLASKYDFEKFRNELLRPLLIERVADTPGLLKAKAHIEEKMPDFYKKEEIDHISPTPFGDKTFRNLVFTSQPDNPRQIVVSCHYDSKFWPNKKEIFIGATDSSFPCALMLQLAQTIGDKVLSSDISLKLVFFDGEEAFVRWTRSDSTYGSQHIAQLWKDKGKFDNIEAFMLLDLLGAEWPTIHHDKSFSSVSRWFERLVKIENDPRVKKLFKNSNQGPFWFDQSFGRYSLGMDDDHKPFHRLGLNRILHIIPAPFPTVWHKIDDNESALDDDTMYKWQVVINLWVMEYLHI